MPLAYLVHFFVPCHLYLPVLVLPFRNTACCLISLCRTGAPESWVSFQRWFGLRVVASTFSPSFPQGLVIILESHGWLLQTSGAMGYGPRGTQAAFPSSNCVGQFSSVSLSGMYCVLLKAPLCSGRPKIGYVALRIPGRPLSWKHSAFVLSSVL